MLHCPFLRIAFKDFKDQLSACLIFQSNFLEKKNHFGIFLNWRDWMDCLFGLSLARKDYTMASRTMFFSAIMSVASAFAAEVRTTTVESGCVLSLPRAYSWYRFAVRRLDEGVEWEGDGSTANGSTKWMRVSELALYDASGNRLNAGLEEMPNPSSTAESIASAVKGMPYGSCLMHGRIGSMKTGGTNGLGAIFDGDEKTEIGSSHEGVWANPNEPESHQWSWGYICMRVAEGTAPVASYNLARVPKMKAMPISWRLEGSLDGGNWHVLDDVNVAEFESMRPADEEFWYNGGRSILSKPDVENVHVKRGGTLNVVADMKLGRTASHGGSVNITPDATATLDVQSGNTERFVGGGLSGSGVFEKTGGGTLRVSGVNSAFFGRIRVSGGTLAFAPLHVPARYEYYRLSFKEKGNYLRVSEIALYDALEQRVNLNLASVEGDDALVGLGPGTVMCLNKGQHTLYSKHTDLFDGLLTSDWNGWVQSSSAFWAQLKFYMKLPAATDLPLLTYNIASSAVEQERNPKSWTLYGGNVATNEESIGWVVLDDRNSSAVSQIMPSTASSWCNGGEPLSLVSENDNPPLGDVNAKYFRFSVTSFGTDGDGGTREIAELALYDIIGNRVNCNLANMGRKYAEPLLPAGSFTRSSEWNGSYNTGCGDERMFDETLTTKMSGWSFFDSAKNDPSNPKQLISYTMRLLDSAPPVAAYNIAITGRGNENLVPYSWQVEASRDGVTWFLVDERKADAAALLLPSARAYCNNSRPIGFTQGLDRHLVPSEAVVEVVGGGRLELPVSSSATIRGLAVDLTAQSVGGTIANFRPSVNGAIHLTVNARKLEAGDTVLPVEFENVFDGENIKNWAVYVNGVLCDSRYYRVFFGDDGALHVVRTPRGLRFIVN